ncbi:hypothetical protein COOONC_05672 [Cooperia oncophora]
MQSLYIVVDRLLSGTVTGKQSDIIREWCRDCLRDCQQLPFTLLLEAVNSDSFRNSLSPFTTERDTFGGLSRFTARTCRRDARSVT